MKIFKKELNKKQERNLRTGVRSAIQLVFFVFSPAIFTTAFSGIKYMANAMGQRQVVELNSFVKTLIALLIYTLIFGRFFCGYACAFGSINDFFRAAYKFVCKKLKKKPLSIPKKATGLLKYLKYLVLLAIVITCFLGLYGKTAGYSPWDVFSMLHALNFRLGAYIPGLVILCLLIVGMCLEDRFFCRFFCPMGAVFSLLPILPFFTLSRDRDQCLKGCSACNRNCIADVELANRSAYEVRGECFMCNKCVGVCPKQNVGTKIKGLRGHEIWFVLLRAIILFVGFYFLVNG